MSGTKMYATLKDFTSNNTATNIPDALAADITAGNIVEISGGSGDTVNYDNKEFTYDGSTNVFELLATPKFIFFVNINSIDHISSADYTIIGNQLTINSALINGDKIETTYVY